VYRRPVESTLIHSVGYDLASSVLEIELVEGQRVYEYYDVPLSVYSELMAAESKGNYFNEVIRDMYSYAQIDPD
jgi:KTSC domain